MPHEIVLLNNYLLVGAVLFGVGLIGFVCRRNMIVMFLSAEIMLQGVSLSLVAWSRFHNDFGGRMLCVVHHRRGGVRGSHRLGAGADALPPPRHTQRRRVARAARGRPAKSQEPLPDAPSERIESLPHLSPAGIAPVIPLEETDYRPRV